MKADQTGWEHSYCVEQVLLPVFAAKPALGRSVREVAVQCARSQGGHYRRTPLPTGTKPWVEVGHYWTGCRRFHLTQAPSLDAVTQLDPLKVTDMAAAGAVSDFLSWGLPSDGPTVLVLWGHGGSWRVPFLNQVFLAGGFPKGVLAEAIELRADDPRFAGLHFLTDGAHRYFLSEDLPPETPLHGLPNLARGVRDGLDRAGRSRLDVLGFNSCFMACIEAAYELRDHAHFMVGSEEETPFEGWRHEEWIRELAAHPGATPEDLSRILVRTYSASSRQETTISAIRLGSGIEAITQSIKAFGTAAHAVEDASWRQVREARGRIEHFGRYGQASDVLMVDIVQLFREIEAHCPALSDAARRVWQECLASVVEADAGPARRGGYGSHGLSIFFPETLAEFERLANRDRYEPGLSESPSFVAASGWRGFLDEFWRRTDGA